MWKDEVLRNFPHKKNHMYLLIKNRVHYSAPDHHLRAEIPTLLHAAVGSWLVKEYCRWCRLGLISYEGADYIRPRPSESKSAMLPP